MEQADIENKQRLDETVRLIGMYWLVILALEGRLRGCLAIKKGYPREFERPRNLVEGDRVPISPFFNDLKEGKISFDIK